MVDEVNEEVELGTVEPLQCPKCGRAEKIINRLLEPGLEGRQL